MQIEIQSLGTFPCTTFTKKVSTRHSRRIPFKSPYSQRIRSCSAYGYTSLWTAFYGQSRLMKERIKGEKAIQGKESHPVLLKPRFCLLSPPPCLPKDRALSSGLCSPEHLALIPDVWNAKNPNKATKDPKTACGWLKNEAPFKVPFIYISQMNYRFEPVSGRSWWKVLTIDLGAAQQLG